MPSDFRTTFDGSTDPGTVTLSDGLLAMRAKFDADDEAKAFYALLLILIDERNHAHRAFDGVASKLRAAVRALDEAQR